MFCANCGARVSENDRFCPECGYPVEAVEKQETPNTCEELDATMKYSEPGHYEYLDNDETVNLHNYNTPFMADLNDDQPDCDEDEYWETRRQQREENSRKRKEEQRKKKQTITLVVLGVTVVVLLAGVIWGVGKLMKPGKGEDYEAPKVTATPTPGKEQGEDKQDEDVVVTETPTETPTPEPTETPTPEPTETSTPTPTPMETPAPTPTLAPVVVVTETPAPTPVPSKEYIFADSNSRYLSHDEVYAKNKQELSYARNEIYARHGRKFKSAELQKYFSGKSWYKPVYEPAEFDKIQNSVFNEYEKENIQQIIKVEKEKGYE